MIQSVNTMRKNEIIPIGPVVDITHKDDYTLKITGKIFPIYMIIDDTMINLIKLKKEYYKSIIDGIKTQTLRKHNKRLKEEEIVKAIFPGTEKECYIQITNTGYKQFKYLNDEDARLEGYKTVDELKKALLKIYPRLDNFDRLYYYQFKVVDENAI